MKRATLLILPLLTFGTACGVLTNHAIAYDPAPKKEPEEAPKRPGITTVDPDKKIDDIKSDTFKMSEATIEGDVLKIKVSYSGGVKKHEFNLYWNQIVAKSYPGKTTINLKHNANGDAAEALITETLEFDLTAINKPMVITIKTDHGDSIRVQYGESKLD